MLNNLTKAYQALRLLYFKSIFKLKKFIAEGRWPEALEILASLRHAASQPAGQPLRKWIAVSGLFWLLQSPMQAQTTRFAPSTYLAGQGRHMADFDNDGDLDKYVVTQQTVWHNEDGYEYIIARNVHFNYYRNDGTALAPVFVHAPSSMDFTIQGTVTLGYSYEGVNHVEFADMDNDGDLDLLYTEQIYNSPISNDFEFLRIRRNVGTPTQPNISDPGSFLASKNLGYAAESDYNFFRVADFDNDGDKDIAFVRINYNETANLTGIRNTGTQTAPIWGPFFFPPGFTTFSGFSDFADVDCDGDEDALCMIDSEQSVQINNGGTFTAEAAAISGLPDLVLDFYTRFIDANGDGNKDILSEDSGFALNQSLEWHLDIDGDGFGSGPVLDNTCIIVPDNAALSCNDCNDAYPSINPSMSEVANSFDDDCNGIIDDVCGAVPTSVLKTTRFSPTSQYIHWDPFNDATYYQLQYRKLGTTAWTVKGTAQSSLLITDLLAGSTYEYRIRTQCPTGGWLPYSPIVTFSTSPVSGTCTKPTGNYARAYSSASARLYWNHVPETQKYRVRYRVNTTGSAWSLKIAVVNPESPTMTLGALTPGTNYVWQVQSRCTDGSWSAFSSLGYFNTDPAAECPSFAAASLIQPPQVAQAPSDLQIFPNPATTAANIVWPDTDSPVTLTVIDASGKVAYRLDEITGGSHTLELQNLPNGIYFVKINGADVTYFGSLLKQD